MTQKQQFEEKLWTLYVFCEIMIIKFENDNIFLTEEKNLENFYVS